MARWRHAWKLLGRLTTITNADASSATISQYGYAYDNLNRVTTHTYDSAIGTYTYNGVNTYTYDHTSQVIGDSGSTFTYDAQGNRTMPGYATGAANRLTNDGVFTYVNDAEGNRISKSKGSGLETWYYTWDNRNRLIGVEQTSDGASILLAVTYTYDAHDKLVAEEKWQSSTGVVATRRHWDGEDLWAITDASNVVATRFLYGDGVDAVQGRIVETGPNGGTQGFYATDNLGSVRDIIDAATGEVLYHAEYDAFGAATEYGAGYGDTLKYTARELDADTGLQYNRARWYDNSVGRWLSEDPIGFAAGDRNLYRYVSNFATGATDPSGLLFFAPRITVEEIGQIVANSWRSLFPTNREIVAREIKKFRDEKCFFAARLMEWHVFGKGQDGTAYTATDKDKIEFLHQGRGLLEKFLVTAIRKHVPKREWGNAKYEANFTFGRDEGTNVRWLEPTIRGGLQAGEEEGVIAKDYNLPLFRALGGAALNADIVATNFRKTTIGNRDNYGCDVKAKISVFDNYSWDSYAATFSDPAYAALYALQKDKEIQSFKYRFEVEVKWRVEFHRSANNGQK
jgi:RHS repeat-associated protein